MVRSSSYHGDILDITEENPELEDGQESNPGNSEKPNPFDAGSNTETETSVDQPEPPAGREGLAGTKFMLVGESVEGESSIAGSENQRRVEEDQASLGKEAVL